MTDIIVPFYGHMRDDVYFGLPAWDQTQLQRFLRSPLEWAASLHEPAQGWMAFGCAAHSLALGTGPAVGLSGDGQAHQTDLAVSLPAEDLSRVRDMAAVTRPLFRRMPGHAETAMVMLEQSTGLLLKGKADFVSTDPQDGHPMFLYDYKTTSRPLDQFPSQITRLGYHIQAAAYEFLLRSTHPAHPLTVPFRFVVQQTHAPYDYRIYELPADSRLIYQGALELRAALRAVKGFEREHPHGLDVLRRAYAPGHRRRRRIARAVRIYSDKHYITPLFDKEQQ